MRDGNHLRLNEVSLCRPLLLTTKAMAKKKKAKGKARKKKAKKAAVDAAGVVVSPAPVALGVSSIHGGSGEQEAALGPFVSLLSQLRNVVSSSSTSLSCTHGWNPFEYDVDHDGHKFIEAIVEMIENRETFHNIVLFSLDYRNFIRSDSIRLDLIVDWIVSSFVSIGTELVLPEGANLACHYFAVIAYSELMRQVADHKTQPAMNFARIVDLQHGDMRRFVSYLKKRIPCSCLDAKYEEVKSLPKKGQCSNCFEKFELCSLMSCESCRKAHYCSKACQKAHWKAHKEYCKIWTEWYANNGGSGAATNQPA